MPFSIFLVHEYLTIVGILYPMDYNEAMSSVGAHSWQGAMRE